MDRLAAGKGHRRRPQGIIGGGDKHLVTVVEQALHGHDDHLGNAVPDVNVLDLDPCDPLELTLLHDRLAGGKQALRIAVRLGRPYVENDIMDDLVGRIEAEDRRVAAVELYYRKPLVFEPLRFFEERAADLVADVLHLVRLHDLAHVSFFSHYVFAGPSRFIIIGKSPAFVNSLTRETQNVKHKKSKLF